MCKESFDLTKNEITTSVRLLGQTPSHLDWQNALENAQNVIFCKEVFAQVRLPNVLMQNSVIVVYVLVQCSLA